MVVLIVRKYNPQKKRIGFKKCPWVFQKTILLPEWITTMEEFGWWLQSSWDEGRYYISLSAKRYRGFKTVFLGFVKDNKAIGSGKIHYYLAKNKEKLANQD